MACLPISDRVSQLQPTAVNRVLQEARQIEAEGCELASLMAGSPIRRRRPILSGRRKALRDGRTGYPDNRGEPALRRAVAEKLRRDQGLSYDPDREILITDGATQGVCAALGALVDRNRPVLLPDPVYDAYHSPIALWGGVPVFIPATLRNGRFTIESCRLESSLVPGTNVILLNTPWNPVGTVLTRARAPGLDGGCPET